jgi:hypothetical protein
MRERRSDQLAAILPVGLAIALVDQYESAMLFGQADACLGGLVDRRQKGVLLLRRDALAVSHAVAPCSGNSVRILLQAFGLTQTSRQRLQRFRIPADP